MSPNYIEGCEGSECEDVKELAEWKAAAKDFLREIKPLIEALSDLHYTLEGSGSYRNSKIQRLVDARDALLRD